MNDKSLDNPGWHALNSHQSHLAIRGEIAARCQPDVLMGAALPEFSAAGFADLGRIVDDSERIAFLAASFPQAVPGWKILDITPLIQMVCADLNPPPWVESVRLNSGDVPEMLELVALAQPGPFLPRTIELGDYFGVRQNGRLVAMAGERLHLTGFCEISAVCTDPDYRRRGYAASLTAQVARGIISRGETPFLSLLTTNAPAYNLYRKLGFKKRKNISVATLKKSAPRP